MTTTADALEVMTVIAACHHRTAPRMDDRDAVMATAGIWAELFSVHNLELPDLIAGVKKRALNHADAPEPAEIIQAARDLRRDRMARESTAERQAREDARDAALDRAFRAEIDRRTLAAINTRLDDPAIIGKAVDDA